VHDYGVCYVCGIEFGDDVFALFVENGELEVEGLPLPPKPKPKYVQKIRNSGGFQSDAIGGMRNQDNLVRGEQLAGLGYCPPLVINSLVRIA
jgi:hypothetical protein